MLLKNFLLAASFAGSALLSAAEIHVSLSGNNKNPGTAQAPVATIARAAALAKPGDTVKIAPGIYRELVVFTRSGKKGAPVTFQGTRGKNGEYLTIVEAPGKVISKWTPAPEAGPKIWKSPLAKRPDLLTMNGAQITLIGQQRMELKPWNRTPAELDATMIWDQYAKKEKCMRLPGFDMLRLPADIKVTHKYFGKRKEFFFPTIANVIAGWHKGTLYVRFADDRKPEENLFTATNGESFVLKNVSYLTFKDLHMRGARRQISITKKSSHITVENSLLMHGAARIYVEPTVTYTTVRNCTMTTGFIRSDLFSLRSADDMRGGLLYLVFKYIIGSAHSDDVGIRCFGSKAKIYDNLFLQGVIGIEAWGPEIEVRDNVVREMSSVGIVTSFATTGEFYRNLIMNCGIPLRIHNLRHQRTKREEYHYKNLFVQGRHGGSQVFVHCESHKFPADAVNFEPGTKNYKKNPPNPVDAGKIHIYHNTFWGGDDRQANFTVKYLYDRFRTVQPFFFCNNIMKDSLWLDTKTHELAGPNLHYVFTDAIYHMSRREPMMPKLNKIIREKEASSIWNKKDLPGLPDLTLAPNSPALGVGVDVSKPFTFNGKKYPAFKGFKPGYFKGKAPAAGALQAGEDMEHFIRKHNQAEAAIRMLAELKKKTAAEARK